MPEINFENLASDIQQTCRYHLEQILLLAIYTRNHITHFERNIKAIKLIEHAIFLLNNSPEERIGDEEFIYVIHQLNKGDSSGALMVALQEKYGDKSWLKQMMLKMDRDNLHFGVDRQYHTKKYCLLLQCLIMSQANLKVGQSVITNMLRMYEKITPDFIQDKCKDMRPSEFEGFEAFDKNSFMVSSLKKWVMDEIHDAIWTNGFNNLEWTNEFNSSEWHGGVRGKIDFHNLYEKSRFKKTPRIDNESWYSDFALTINDNLMRNIKAFGYIESLGGWLARPLVSDQSIKQNVKDEISVTSDLYTACKAKPIQKITQFAKVIARIIEHDVKNYESYELNTQSSFVEHVSHEGGLGKIEIPEIKKGYQSKYTQEETTRLINQFFSDIQLMNDWKKLESAEHRFKGKFKALHYGNEIEEILTKQAKKIEESSITLPWSKVRPVPLYIL